MAKRLWRLHSVLGLSGGLFLLLIGLSGSVLVFAEELDTLLHPQLRRAATSGMPAVDYDRIYAAVCERWPDAWDVRFRRLPQAPGETVQMALSRNSERMADDWFHVYVHPETAEILGWKHALGGYGFAHHPVDWLLWFHYSLHAGKVGELIVAAMSVVLLGSALTGGWIYRRQFRRGLLLRVRWRNASSRIRWADVHGVVGVWSLVLNGVLGATGFWLTRAVWSREFFHAAPPVTHHAPAPRPAAGYNAAMASVAREWPGFIPSGLSAITESTANYQVYGRLLEEPRIFGAGASEITIDGASGRLKETRFLRDRSVVERLSIAAGPLHFGSFGGLPVQILWTIGGLAPGILTLSGVLIWLRRRPSAAPMSPSAGRRKAG